MHFAGSLQEQNGNTRGNRETRRAAHGAAGATWVGWSVHCLPHPHHHHLFCAYCMPAVFHAVVPCHSLEQSCDPCLREQEVTQEPFSRGCGERPRARLGRSWGRTLEPSHASPCGGFVPRVRVTLDSDPCAFRGFWGSAGDAVSHHPCSAAAHGGAGLEGVAGGKGCGVAISPAPKCQLGGSGLSAPETTPRGSLPGSVPLARVRQGALSCSSSCRLKAQRSEERGRHGPPFCSFYFAPCCYRILRRKIPQGCRVSAASW